MTKKIGLFLAAALLASSAAWANVTLNLKDAEIGTLIATVSEVTGKNFIVDSRVKGKVTVISARPMTPAGVYETFLGVLQVNGFAAIPDGQAIKIVPEANARQDGGVRTDTGKGLPIDDVVTYVFTLENVSATQLVPILRPLIPQWGHLAAYAPANQLIISDRAGNVRRIADLIRQMDQSSDRSIEIIKLKHAGAAEVVRILTSLGQQDKTADPTTKQGALIADERSNSVLLGGDKNERVKLKAVIEQLDQPLNDDGATQVVYLRYASAENLAPILEGYAQQAGQASNAAGAPQAAPSGGGNDRSRVIADKDTNALIITAPPKVMRQIRDVIAQLDIQRAQVLVEAVIAEVSASKSAQLGVDWALFNRNRVAAASIPDLGLAGAVAGAASTNTNGALTALASALPGFLIGGGIDGGDNGTSLAVVLKALSGDGDTNILSTPTLVTLDNEEAKFSAGQELPFLTGQFSNTGSGSNNGTVNPFQTIERRDVGLTLGVTPQISEGDTIKLKIDLEASALASGTTGVQLNPTTTKRKLTNTVGVQSGQILVIGGLIDDQIADTESGIPFLSKIPLIGSLFSSRSVTKNKRNLMIFIKSTVLRKESDVDYYTRRKYDSLRGDQLRAAQQGALPLIGGRRPVLPEFDQFNLDRPPVEVKAAPKVEARPETPVPPPAPEAVPATPVAPAGQP